MIANHGECISAMARLARSCIGASADERGAGARCSPPRYRHVHRQGRARPTSSPRLGVGSSAKTATAFLLWLWPVCGTQRSSRSPGTCHRHLERYCDLPAPIDILGGSLAIIGATTYLRWATWRFRWMRLQAQNHSDGISSGEIVGISWGMVGKHDG